MSNERLVEVWGDTVDTVHLGLAVIIGSVISLACLPDRKSRTYRRCFTSRCRASLRDAGWPCRVHHLRRCLRQAVPAETRSG